MKNRFWYLLLFAAEILLFPACQQEKESSTNKPEINPSPKAAGDSLVRFSYTTATCENTGFYSKGKYSENELRNTYNLLTFGDPLLETSEILERPEEVNNKTVAKTVEKLDAEYDALKQKFSTAELVPVLFWQNNKKLRLLQLEELYNLKRLTLQAHTKPEILLTSAYANACSEYVKALATNDTAILFRSRRKVLMERQNHSGDPETLTHLYEKEYHSPIRIFLARKELLEYGWWNCANKQRKYADFETQELLEREFEKLFVKVNSDCLGPLK